VKLDPLVQVFFEEAADRLARAWRLAVGMMTSFPSGKQVSVPNTVGRQGAQRSALAVTAKSCVSGHLPTLGQCDFRPAVRAPATDSWTCRSPLRIQTRKHQAPCSFCTLLVECFQNLLPPSGFGWIMTRCGPRRHGRNSVAVVRFVPCDVRILPSPIRVGWCAPGSSAAGARGDPRQPACVFSLLLESTRTFEIWRQIGLAFANCKLSTMRFPETANRAAHPKGRSPCTP